MELIKIRYIHKPLYMKPNQVKRRRNYLEQSGYVFVGFGAGKDDIEDAKFEKRVQVGDAITGMLEWIKVYSVVTKIVDLRGDDVTVCHCVVCCSEWPEGDEPDHYDSCDAEKLKETFSDE